MRRMLLLTLAALGALALAASATAGKAINETFHDEGSFGIENYCDEAGLDVEVAFVSDGRVHIVAHGADQLEYFLQHGKLAETITNTANGRYVTTFTNVIEKDQVVTDNGDGTFSILAFATGNAVLYDANGKALARDPGQIRFEILIDQAGEDHFVKVIRESTGRSDDLCDAAVPALTGSTS